MAWSVRRIAAMEDPEDEVFLVALAEEEDGSGHNLIFQIPLEPDPDEEPEAAPYYICDEDGRGLYGGLAEWSITNSELSLTLTEEAISVLGQEATGIFPLQIPADDIERLRQGIERLLAR